MSYNTSIILNEILTNSTYSITRANSGLFNSSAEWAKLKQKILTIPEDCQLIYLEGWIKYLVDHDKKEKEEKDRKEKEEKDRKEKEEKDRKEREEKDRKEREERESSIARHTLFAHYGPGLAFAIPTPGYPGRHLVHLGGGAFIPSAAPIGFIAPGFIPGPCFVRAHRF